MALGQDPGPRLSLYTSSLKLPHRTPSRPPRAEASLLVGHSLDCGKHDFKNHSLDPCLLWASIPSSVNEVGGVENYVVWLL